MALSTAARKALTNPNNIFGVKKYIVNDGAGNPIEIYSAFSNAVTGDPCVLIEVAYDGTGNPEKLSGSESVWNSSYDI